MTEKVDKDVQVDDSNLPLISFEIEEYKNKRKNMESLLEKMMQVSITVQKFMDETDDELRLAEDMKKSRLDRQVFKQRNIDLREETEYMKEYIKLKEEKDELELHIMELDMKKQHRVTNLENRYLINMNQCQMFQSYPQQPQQLQQPLQIQQPQQMQQLQQIQPATISTTAPPPPALPPPPPQAGTVKKTEAVIAPPATHNTVKPTNINDELKTLLQNKFKNANPDN